MSEASIASILSTSSDTSRLRLLAGNGDENVNDEVLQQFEALFLQQMLKSMRTASLSDGMFQSEQTEFYRDMYDQQIAADLAQKEVLGISQLINRQLGGREQIETPNESADITSINIADIKRIPHVDVKAGSDDKQLQGVESLVQRFISEIHDVENKRVEELDVVRPLAFKPETPDQFVDYAYEFSHKPAKELGVDAEVIIAIAALETGWGKHLPTDNGGSSNNYFGIKADDRWSGNYVTSQTLEFEENTFNELKQSFRAYDNLKESFNDFADFILGNERYAQALEFAHDTKRFLHEIQNAGYATDPKYADKILNVLNNKAFEQIR